jgi:hypothetical protein
MGSCERFTGHVQDKLVLLIDLAVTGDEVLRARVSEWLREGIRRGEEAVPFH